MTKQGKFLDFDKFLLTPLREGRHEALERLRMIFISTHAPAGGATDAGRHRHQDERISTHAPAGGATRKRTLVPHVPGRISTHAPAGGATRHTPIPSTG